LHKKYQPNEQDIYDSSEDDQDQESDDQITNQDTSLEKPGELVSLLDELRSKDNLPHGLLRSMEANINKLPYKSLQDFASDDHQIGTLKKLGLSKADTIKLRQILDACLPSKVPRSIEYEDEPPEIQSEIGTLQSGDEAPDYPSRQGNELQSRLDTAPGLPRSWGKKEPAPRTLGSQWKFLHAADIHLDSPLYGLERYEGAPIDEIRNATRRAFDNLVELAIEDEEVALILLVGDLYDGDWKDYNTGLYLVERMGRLREAGIRVYVVAGNHDAASQITRHLRLPDNVTLFSTRHPERVVLDDLNVAIHGQGFATRAVTDDLSESYPQGDSQLFNIGMLHTCLDGKPGHEHYAPCSVDGLRSKGYQYWALGHVHNREVVSQDPWIVFPGNIQGRHMRELGPKGCTVVSVENGEIADVEHRDLDVMRWSLCELDVSASESVDDIYEQVRAGLLSASDAAEGRPVAVRLVLRGACAAHSTLHADRERWTQEYRALATGLGGAGIWLEKVAIKTRPSVSEDEVLERDDALSGLLRAVRDMELDTSALGELAEELYAFRQKLPAELLGGDDPYDPTKPEMLKETLEDIKEFLVNRLLTTEKGA
jgi:exonuclease SbcD